MPFGRRILQSGAAFRQPCSKRLRIVPGLGPSHRAVTAGSHSDKQAKGNHNGQESHRRYWPPGQGSREAKPRRKHWWIAERGAGKAQNAAGSARDTAREALNRQEKDTADRAYLPNPGLNAGHAIPLWAGFERGAHPGGDPATCRRQILSQQCRGRAATGYYWRRTG